MKINLIIGFALVIAAGVLACVFATGGATNGPFGMAVWYLPYVAFVGGVERLARARS